MAADEVELDKQLLSRDEVKELLMLLMADMGFSLFLGVLSDGSGITLSFCPHSSELTGIPMLCRLARSRRAAQLEEGRLTRSTTDGTIFGRRRAMIRREGSRRLWFSRGGRYGGNEKMGDNSTPHGAKEYDEEILRTVPFYRRFHAETIDLVRMVRPGVSVWLDTGCGTGYLVEQALPVFPETRFLLADPARAMLETAGARLASYPLARVSLLGAMATEQLEGNVPETPDVISAIQCHHYGRNEARRRATSACFRLLGAGGLYVTFENIRPDTARGVEIGLDRWAGFERAAGRPTQAVEEHRARFDRDYFPITVPEHLELLRTSGFSVAEIFWRSHMQAGFYAIK